MENEKSPPQLPSHSSQGSCLVHITGRAKWKTEIYETRISILRLFGIHRLLSQSAFSCFLLLLKSFESELFCIDGTNVRSDILICPPLPFPPCHDDPILNKKRLGAYISERVAAHIWLFTYTACVRLCVRGWRGKLLLMRAGLTKAESELLCMKAGWFYQHTPPRIYIPAPLPPRIFTYVDHG